MSAKTENKAKSAKKKRVVQVNKKNRMDSIEPIIYSAVGVIVVLLLLALLLVMPIKILNQRDFSETETSELGIDDNFFDELSEIENTGNTDEPAEANQTEHSLNNSNTTASETEVSEGKTRLWAYNLELSMAEEYFLEFTPKDMKAGN
ncbi:MAG: hypothetical protein V1659_01780, partial [Candidatus Woesearchaeota archaeon]